MKRRLLAILALVVLVVGAISFLLFQSGTEKTTLPPLLDEERHNCLEGNRGGDIYCLAVYNPVCGWFDSTEIQCIKYPCAQTFGNSCEACRNEQVAYWTNGECPV